MTEAAGAPESRGPSRTRLIAARVLTVVAVLLALVGMLAFYVAHTALDEAGFETISRNMIENDAIRTQVANTAVDQLYANVDVEAAIAERLPPNQKGLAPVLAGLSRSGADQAAVAALERPRVQTAWVEVTTATQRQLVRLLDDKNQFVQTDGGKVVLDLRPIMIQLGDQVVVIGRLAEKLPESAGRSRSSKRASSRLRRRSRRSCAQSQLDVARRACGRRPRNLAGPRASQARAPRTRDRRARRRAPDAGRTPRCGRLSRRPTRQGRQRQAGGTRRVEHPDAGACRPRVGMDRPRCRDARRCLVRR